MKHTKEFKVSDGLQSIGELWRSVASLAAGRVADNEKNKELYPLEIREIQAASLECLVKNILLTHEKMKEQNNG